MGNALQGMEDALVNFVTTGKLAFGDLARSIINDMIRIMIQQAIMKPFTGWLSGMFGSADGNVIAGGEVKKYKSGGIVSRPTYFPMKNGMGLMGEAGAEVIMPLKRGRNGKLGVQASGGTGSITISTSHKATSAGTLYRTSDLQETGSIAFEVNSSGFSDQTFISFQSAGEIGLDNADGYKLFPLNHGDRILAISYADDKGLDINNLPYEYEESISIPFDIMQLQLVDDTYVTQENEVSLTWDVSDLPDHISLKLIELSKIRR